MKDILIRYTCVKSVDYRKDKIKEHKYIEDKEHSAMDEYISRNGYHFTPLLGEWASSLMINANGVSHTWNTAQVEETLRELNITIPKRVTLGDMVYLVNMFYADLYPEPLQTEEQCFIAAYKMATDPDGVEGSTFRRWLADSEDKVMWEDFLR